jgi:carbamoyltransferase
MLILGINAFHADASAALLRDGQLVAAIEEERLDRVKHSAGFPWLASRAVVEMGGATAADLDHVAISRDPTANWAKKLLRVLSGGTSIGVLRTRLRNAERVRGIAEPLAQALGVERIAARVHAVEHHRAHLASAFFCSPFEDAAVMSIDGFGDFVSTMWARGHDRSLEVLGQVGYPHSLGVLYTATCQWLGFDGYGDEGRVMGLAPYGRPIYVEKLGRAVQLTDDGFKLDLGWFTHATSGVAMTWEKGTPKIGRLWSDRFVEEFGPARVPRGPLTEHHHDVAASLQAVTERAIVHLCRLVHRRVDSPRLCLAGGVALNSVANGKLRAQTPFRELYIQPAAGDGGTALGAAQFVEHAILGRPRRMVLVDPATGPEFSAEACAAAIARSGLDGAATVERIDDEGARIERTAGAIAAGGVVGWFEGRMEFGPRALGHRSVLADPRRAEMKDVLNRRVKHREPFRPFAPAILAERAGDWFVDAQPSPAMLLVLPFAAERQAAVPAVVHVDGSGRLQTVDREHSPRFHALIAAFERLTGVPILLNTSFNDNEPIVCTPDDALACFQRTSMDLLVLGPFLVERRNG